MDFLEANSIVIKNYCDEKLRDPPIYSTDVERLFFARLHEAGLTERNNYAKEVQHSFKAVLSQSGAQGVAYQAQEQKKEVGARDLNYSKRSLFSMADGLTGVRKFCEKITQSL